MADLEGKLRAFEIRLARLEDAVLGLATRGATPASAIYAPGPASTYERADGDSDEFFKDTAPMAFADTHVPSTVASPRQSRPVPVPPPTSDLSVTQIMGWTGTTLLVLAAAYLIRLVYDAGWLTPNRQLVLAVLSGAGLIVAGLKLRRMDNNYASLLPAGGLVVLFLTIYGAHLYYHQIGAGVAAAAVICNCLLALWLGRVFASEIYGLFAVVGSYSAPLLLPALSGSVVDLAIYFTAWSLVFCVYSLAIANRRPYLLAGYMALVAFQLVWEHMAHGQWVAAVVFQALQFAVFVSTAIVFSIRHARPMTQSEGIAHLPLLLLFYGLQYHLLHLHMPGIPPWLAVASAALLLAAYWVARRVLNASLETGAFIVGAYCALVLFHAVYLELLPDRWAPWVVLLALPFGALNALRSPSGFNLMLPFNVLFGGLFVINFVRVVLGDVALAGNSTLLAFLYTLELYAAYFVGRRMPALDQWIAMTLYAAHLGLMAVALQTFDNVLLVSLAWGALALAAVTLAFRTNDQVLGKSSLLIFAASLIKVILFDLSGAAPLVRIGSLVVVGISLYAGGMLYKRVLALED